MIGRFLVFLVLLAIIAGGWYYMHQQGQQKAGGAAGGAKGAMMMTPDVEVIPVKSQKLYDSVEVPGDAKANESVAISANVSETIKQINFTDGQYVHKGDVIALLDQSEEQAQLKAAELQLQEQNRELERTQELFKHKAASKRDYDEHKTQRDIAAQAIEEIKAKIEDRTIKAPFDGVLGIRQVSVGALLQPGEVITTIDDIDTIKLDFNVPSVFMSSLAPGMSIKAKVEALGGRVFDGTVATVNTRIDPVTRSILVRALIPNANHILKPGLLMQVTLLRNQREGLVVPEESIVQKANQFFVMVVKDDDTLEQREVTPGAHYTGIMEITDGLKAGEKVIVRGLMMARPGMKVKVIKVWDKIRAPDPGDLKSE